MNHTLAAATYHRTLSNLSLASLHAIARAVSAIRAGVSRDSFLSEFEPALRETMAQEWQRALALIALEGSDAEEELARWIVRYD